MITLVLALVSKWPWSWKCCPCAHPCRVPVWQRDWQT